MNETDFETMIAEARDVLGRVNTNAVYHDSLFQYRGGVLVRELTLIVRDLADALESVRAERDAALARIAELEREAAGAPAPQEPSDAWVDRQLAAEVAAKIETPAPSPDREKLIAEAEALISSRGGGRRDSRLFRRLLDALEDQSVLDPEKVRRVIAPSFNNDADGSWGPFSPEDMATRALCEAAKRGELSI